MEFEWDERKAKDNLRKHKVSFQESAEGFYDPHGLELDDTQHSKTEIRHYWIGKVLTT